MPGFGRLTRSNNRPQPAFVEQVAAGPPPSTTVAGTAAAANTAGNQVELPSSSGTAASKTNPPSALPASTSALPQQQPPPPLATAAASSASEASFDLRQGPLPPTLHPPQGQGAQGPQPQHQQQQQQQQHRSPLDQEREQPQQPQPQRQPEQHFPLRSYAPEPVGDNSQPALQPRSYSSLDNHRDYTDHADTDAAGNHAQNHRFSAIFPQQYSHSQQHHHHLHQHTLPRPQKFGFTSSSVDDLHSGAAYQQQPATPAPAPPPAHEKRSTRKLIKGIFSGSSSRSSAQDHTHHHHHHHTHHQQQPPPQQQQQQQQHLGRNAGAQDPQPSSDHPPVLTRKSSKRASNPPAVTTNFSHPTSKTPSPHHDWPRHTLGPYSQQESPLQGVGEVDEYHYSDHDPNQQQQQQQASLHQDSLPLASTTIRRVDPDIEASPYDEATYPQHQHQHQQQHQQQQQQQQQPLPHQIPQPAPLPQAQHQHQYQSPPHSTPQPPTPSLELPQEQAAQQTIRDQGYEQEYSPHLQPDSVPTQRYPTLVTESTSLSTAGSELIPHSRQYSSESISQASHDSPSSESDQRSNEQPSPAISYSAIHTQDFGRAPSPGSFQQVGHQHPQFVMTPPGGGQQQQPRRTQVQPQTQTQSQAQAQAQVQVQDAERLLRGIEPPPGPPPGYRNSGASMNAAMSPLPPAPNQGPGGSQTSAFRPERSFEVQGEGRDSPQPPNPDQSAIEGEKAFKDLLTKYKNVKRLYFDGKSQIEGLSSQVEQLQNAVANQRMSQSRTALDDNEYSTRFNRLNGAINNLSFNIRKDWRTVPQWLEKFVSADALKTGKQEMTAVGRAVITRWLVEEVFNKCFHPGLDPTLSAQLKEIELSIRGNAYNMQSQEEYDALTTRIVNWRMATLDGLQRRLNSSATGDNRNMLTTRSTANLTACLYQYLSNPPPPGVEGSTSMIVELAVGIAANLPLESRDVAIMYPLPGDPVQPHLMEVEKMGLPTLEAHRAEGDLDADDDLDKDRNAKARVEKAKANALVAMGAQGGRKGSVTGDLDAGSGVPKDSGIVRFAGFMALEVRGRQVLMKAPVWTL